MNTVAGRRGLIPIGAMAQVTGIRIGVIRVDPRMGAAEPWMEYVEILNVILNEILNEMNYFFFFYNIKIIFFV